MGIICYLGFDDKLYIIHVIIAVAVCSIASATGGGEESARSRTTITIEDAKELALENSEAIKAEASRRTQQAQITNSLVTVAIARQEDVKNICAVQARAMAALLEVIAPEGKCDKITAQAIQQIEAAETADHMAAALDGQLEALRGVITDQERGIRRQSLSPWQALQMADTLVERAGEHQEHEVAPMRATVTRLVGVYKAAARLRVECEEQRVRFRNGDNLRALMEARRARYVCTVVYLGMRRTLVDQNPTGEFDRSGEQTVRQIKTAATIYQMMEAVDDLRQTLTNAVDATEAAIRQSELRATRIRLIDDTL